MGHLNGSKPNKLRGWMGDQVQWNNGNICTKIAGCQTSNWCEVETRSNLRVHMYVPAVANFKIHLVPEVPQSGAVFTEVELG